MRVISYPFFLVHMLGFGVSGFMMAYFAADIDVSFLYAHGGIAIFVYLMFYLNLFGVDSVKWMFINAGLGLWGVYAQVGWILGLFGKSIADYPWYVHVVPFLYFILYTFLVRQLLIDISGARKRPQRMAIVNMAYVVLLTLVGAIPLIISNL